MKNSKRLLAISYWLLAIVIFFSGCVGGEKKETFSPGIEAVSFNAPRQIDSEEQFEADLIVQNTGDKDATNIQADLFQTSGITILKDEIQESQKLLPPNIEKGIEGENKIFTWSLKAPALTEDQTKSLQARVTYDYTSTASSNFYIVPKAEYDEKGPSAFPTYSTSSNGPVTLSITPMPPFKTSVGKNPQVQLNLIIENTGPGRVVGDEIRDFAIILKGEFAGESGEQYTPSCYQDVVDGKIKLYGKDQKRAIRCNFEMSYSETARSYIVEASIAYTYYIDTNPLAIRIKAA